MLLGQVGIAAAGLIDNLYAWVFLFLPSLHFLIAVTVFLARFCDKPAVTPSFSKTVVPCNSCLGQQKRVFPEIKKYIY